MTPEQKAERQVGEALTIWICDCGRMSWEPGNCTASEHSFDDDGCPPFYPFVAHHRLEQAEAEREELAARVEELQNDLGHYDKANEGLGDALTVLRPLARELYEANCWRCSPPTEPEPAGEETVCVVESGEYEQRGVDLVAADERAAVAAIKALYADYTVTWGEIERTVSGTTTFTELSGCFEAEPGKSTEHTTTFDLSTFKLHSSPPVVEEQG